MNVLKCKHFHNRIGNLFNAFYNTYSRRYGQSSLSTLGHITLDLATAHLVPSLSKRNKNDKRL